MRRPASAFAAPLAAPLAAVLMAAFALVSASHASSIGFNKANTFLKPGSIGAALTKVKHDGLAKAFAALRTALADGKGKLSGMHGRLRTLVGQLATSVARAGSAKGVGTKLMPLVQRVQDMVRGGAKKGVSAIRGWMKSNAAQFKGKLGAVGAALKSALRFFKR